MIFYGIVGYDLVFKELKFDIKNNNFIIVLCIKMNDIFKCWYLSFNLVFKNVLLDLSDWCVFYWIILCNIYLFRKVFRGGDYIIKL